MNKNLDTQPDANSSAIPHSAFRVPHSPHSALLKMRAITKRFSGTLALRDVSLDLREGEILALVGENGAGKSTLMKILSGAYPRASYEGEILIRGESVAFDGPADSEHAGIEMIYQEISMHLDLSIAENIFLGRLPKDRFGLVDWTGLRDKAHEALARVGIDDSPMEIVRDLSVSRQQLVAIARALSRNPQILVLDEPTSALTEQEATRLLTLVAGLRDRGLACIYISHKLNEVFAIADRITVLRDGQTVATHACSEANRERVIADMVGRKIEQMFPKHSAALGPEVLRAEHITVPHPYTRHKNIIQDVGFHVCRGEILGIAGLVGSGRSELVNAVFGALEHDGDARIQVEGRALRIETPWDAIQAGIGLLTEDRRKNGYIGMLNVCANITLASLDRISSASLIDNAKERDVAQRYCEELDIRGAGLDAEMYSLSGGNQQKAILARWLMRNLRVLILDEPTRGIDIGAKVKIYEIMNELVRRGVGIVMISSELPELMAMCDRFMVLANGRIADEFPRRDMSAERIMHACMGMRNAECGMQNIVNKGRES